jgi:hypothetical protein
MVCLLTQATGWECVQEELSKAYVETRTNVSRYTSLLKDTNLLYELKVYTLKGEKAYCNQNISGLIGRQKDQENQINTNVYRYRRFSATVLVF